MKRIFLFLLFISVLTCNVKGEEFEGFTYTTNQSKTQVTITGYNGPSGSIIVPSKIGEMTVTKVDGLIPTGCSNEYTDIFIPKTVESVRNLSTNHIFLQSLVLDSDNIQASGNTVIIIDNLFDPSLQFDNIIIFREGGSPASFKDANYWFSSNTHLKDINRIKIQISGQKSSLYARFYLFDTSNKFIFSDKTFQYLLNALKMRGTSLSEISSIDLSSIETTITFSDGFNPSSLLAIGASVKVSKELTYTNEGILPDLVDFNAPNTDQNNITIKYSRSNTKDWNSVCLPFAIEESYFPEGTKIYTFYSSDENSITLKRTEKEVDAGCPCFIYSEAESWDLTIENASICRTVKAQTESRDVWQLVGSFDRHTIGPNKYKLTEDGKEMNSTVTEEATVGPFRCYVEATNTSGNAPARLSVGVEEGLPISVILSDEPDKKLMLYDLMGRPNAEKKGFKIVNGKTVLY